MNCVEFGPKPGLNTPYTVATLSIRSYSLSDTTALGKNDFLPVPFRIVQYHIVKVDARFIVVGIETVEIAVQLRNASILPVFR